MAKLTYLNLEQMQAIDPVAFRQATPYPWVNPAGFITEAGYQRLVETLPDRALFTQDFGYTRPGGQQSHDRYSLDYRRDLPVAEPWHAFVNELLGVEYRRFLERMLGRGSFRLQFHWHYTPRGCSVSPHCDARRKLGSHIFYLNTEEDWDPTWGGPTLILDDGARFETKSAPDFEDFDRITTAEALGNHSLLFVRRGNSWHGMRELTCPEQMLRKVFIVVIDDWRPRWRLVNLVRGRWGAGYRVAN
jgi:hypothetical protein